MTELKVENLHLDYGTNPVLKGVSMELNKGEVVTLLGPSGSGKTTLLRAVAGLEKPSKGRITLGNRIIYEGSTGKEILVEDRNLGLVFQSYALWPHMTIFDNIAYPLKLRKVSSVEIKQRVQAVLDQLGLGNLGQRYPHQLSGGQQQRVAIGRGLIYNPPVLLLDEPLSNLDAKLREEARVFLRGLIVELNLSALMVTHDQNEAMAISDRILLLNNGVIEQQGTPQDMYATPKSLFTGEFMGSNNRLNGQICELKDGYVRIQGTGWTLWGKSVDDLILNQEVTVIIRVEQVKLNDSNEDNSLERPLLTKMYLGSHWEYLFRESDENSPVLRAFSSDRHYEGVCRLSMPKDQVWVFART